MKHEDNHEFHYMREMIVDRLQDAIAILTGEGAAEPMTTKYLETIPGICK